MVMHMDQTVHELYSPEDLAGLERKERRALTAAIAVSAVTLAGCVLLCCLAGRFDTALLEKLTVGLSILGGWVAITLFNFPVKESRRERVHAKMLLETPRECLEGVLEVSTERMRIRGSIRFYALALRDGETVRRSKVIAERAGLLRSENGKKLRLYTANGYAAAWEEL